MEPQESVTAGADVICRSRADSTPVLRGSSDLCSILMRCTFLIGLMLRKLLLTCSRSLYNVGDAEGKAIR